MGIYELYQKYLAEAYAPKETSAGLDPYRYLYYPYTTQSDSGGVQNVFKPNLAVGQQAPGALMTFLTTMVAPPVGLAMQLQRMADRNQLPSNLNKFFGSRSSADVEAGLPQSNVIDMNAVYNDMGSGNSSVPGSDMGYSGRAASDWTDL